MDRDEFVEWLALYQLEPFGDERRDLGHAIVAKTIVDVNSTSKSPPTKVQDFMPKWYPDPPKPPATPQQQRRIMESLATAFNAKRVTSGDDR